MHRRAERFGCGKGRSLAAACVAIACVCTFFTFALSANAAAAGCFAKPSSCGYPDATNTGVPAGTTLTPSASKTITTNGTVINALEITGTVTVAADNVTIKNSKITATKGGSGTYAVILNNGADNFTIEHTEVTGPASETAGLQSAVWNHYGNPGVYAKSDYFHHCADCWEGPGVFENDFMLVDASYTGSHNEDIYVCGAKVDVEHSTLYNTVHQTATVFGDTAGCGGNTFEIHNSLLAGGGYMLYPQGNATSSVGTMNITGNRLARCLSGTVYDSSTGGTYCASHSGDTNGYYPYGGFYGVASYYFTGGANVWSNNVWDDNGKPICPTGNEGCGTASPPPVVEEPPAKETPAKEPPAKETPAEEPPAKETPVEEPPAKEEAPKGGGHTTPPLEAVLTLPNEILATVPVVLNGTESTGSNSLSCHWSIATETGTETLNGCLATYTFKNPGTQTVTLKVSNSSGRSDTSHESVTVLPSPTSSSSSTKPAGSTPGGSALNPVPGAAAKVAQTALAVSAAVPAQAAATNIPSTAPDARAAWKAPKHAAARSKLRLVAAVGDSGATCTWTVAPRGARHRAKTEQGCAATLRVPAHGSLQVRLEIRGADGSVSTVRRTIAVRPSGHA
jgi:hypothetical protein